MFLCIDVYVFCVNVQYNVCLDLRQVVTILFVVSLKDN